MNREEILAKAKEAGTGQREQDYGRAEDSFQEIADFWKAYKNLDFSPKDVAIMMALMKIARIKTGHDKEDSYVDACGYISLAGEVAFREEFFKENKPQNTVQEIFSTSNKSTKAPCEKRGLKDISDCYGCKYHNLRDIVCNNPASRVEDGVCEYGKSNRTKREDCSFEIIDSNGERTGTYIQPENRVFCADCYVCDFYDPNKICTRGPRNVENLICKSYSQGLIKEDE